MARFGRKVKAEASIPTASMADISFLLLFFLLSITIFEMGEGLDVHLPKSLTGEKLPRESVSRIWIDAGGKISIDDKTVSMQEIEPVIARKWRDNPGMIVEFKADRDLRYRVMHDAIEQLKRANALSVAFSTDEELSGTK